MCVMQEYLCASLDDKARRRQLVHDSVPWDTSRQTCRAGSRRRPRTGRKRREQAKRVEDLARNKMLPSVERIKGGTVRDGCCEYAIVCQCCFLGSFLKRHPGVHEARLSLLCIDKYYQDKDDLSLAARARVNADLLGIVFCNGFAVHNMEGQNSPWRRTSIPLCAQHTKQTTTTGTWRSGWHRVHLQQCSATANCHAVRRSLYSSTPLASGPQR